jgi:hypothetical protein
MKQIISSSSSSCRHPTFSFLHLFSFRFFLLLLHPSSLLLSVSAQGTPSAMCPSSNFTTNTYDPLLYTTVDVDVRLFNDSVRATKLWKRLSDGYLYLPLASRAPAVTIPTSWTAAKAAVFSNFASCTGIDSTMNGYTADSRQLVIFFRAVRVVPRVGGPALIDTRDVTFAEMCGITNPTSTTQVSAFCIAQMYGSLHNSVYGRTVSCNACQAPPGPWAFATVDLRGTIFSVPSDAFQAIESAPVSTPV